MSHRNLIIGFLWRFGLIYGLLILPWPGFSDFYGASFRNVGDELFGEKDSHRVLYFESDRETRGLAALDSRIVLENPERTNETGKSPAVYLGLGTRSIGWIPTALIIALVLATPIPWKRRALALLWGLLLVQLFIIASIEIYIWNESTRVSLNVLGPFWKAIADAVEYTLITQLGASFSVPVLIWIVVTFRSQDRKRFN